MTLDEAIKHAREKGCSNNSCGEEHKQLADWLEELKTLRAINEVTSQDVETSDAHPMERLEELRRTLKSIMRPEVLQCLLELSKALDKGPEQYHYFLTHSIVGADCKYAVAALEKFKKTRLDKVKSLLEECLEKIDKL